MELKGDRGGLTLVADGYRSEAELLADLVATLEARARFLGEARLEVAVQGLALTPALLQAIAEVFQRYPKLTLGGVRLDADRRVPIPFNGRSRNPAPLVVRRTVRSGQRISHSGDLMVVGDVNPGADLVAGGDIYVFGRLLGKAFAGQPKDAGRAIYALDLSPIQIRVGEVWAINDQGGGRPEFARVEEGRIVVRPWADLHRFAEWTQTRTKSARAFGR
ncbi:MAG: septum site-determining protein MinC [Firmicutes bacterium]|nr:septum site-determining protein MinC [Alicyclobacillaceae bacterium]MCL6497669.1 septum site-determining protein MinC [Bacillota bacterium]